VTGETEVIRIGHVCHSCARIDPSDTDAAYLRLEDAWLCPECWRGLPTHEIARLVQEVALRGVPMS
jgi:hypothetical protein